MNPSQRTRNAQRAALWLMAAVAAALVALGCKAQPGDGCTASSDCGDGLQCCHSMFKAADYCSNPTEQDGGCPPLAAG